MAGFGIRTRRTQWDMSGLDGALAAAAAGGGGGAGAGALAGGAAAGAGDGRGEDGAAVDDMDSLEPWTPTSSSHQRLVIVSMQLPLRAKQAPETGQWEFEWDEDSLVAQIKDCMGLESHLRVVHVGTLPVYIEDPAEQDRISAHLASTFACLPLFLDERLYGRFYDGFCKQYIWPLFHYLLPLHPEHGVRFERNHWQAYVAANKKFSDKVMEIVNPDRDYIWIHDYHLMALSTFIRRKYNNVRLGFFLHSPFPSSEIYRTCVVREELLRAVLNSDLIGFHTFDYARHFLSCCSRMLGLEFESKRGYIGLEYYGRTVSIKIMPVGVRVDRLIGGFKWPECQWRLGELRSQYEGKTVFVGMDDVDPFKGLAFKFQALEIFLEQHPEWHGRFVLVQVANSARGSAKFEQLREELRHQVAHINSRFGYDAVEFLERHVPLHERIALYHIAECAIVTAVRDGLNLVPYEYIACRQGLTDEDANAPRSSSLIVSEFMGCSPSLSGAIRVNPWDVESVADAMFTAISLPDAERELRHAKHFAYVARHTVGYWAQSVVADLQRACRRHSLLRCYNLGLGLGFRVVALNPNFRKLEAGDVLSSYARCRNRAILLDYDGTMMASSNAHAGGSSSGGAGGASLAHSRTPSPDVLTVLQQLSADRRNHVFIVSGRDRRTLHNWFGGIERLGLAAEHGFFYRWPGADMKAASWDQLLPASQPFLWKEVALPIMQQYMESTDGSYIEEKESALVWHYGEADPAFGSWQAKELLDHLESVLSSTENVAVVSGQGIVEVKPSGVSKGVVVERVLTAISQGPSHVEPDFVLCIGDDRSDEDMFQQVETVNFSPHLPAQVFACTVGQKPSKAKYYLNDTVEVMELLHALAQVSTSHPQHEQQQMEQ